MPHLDKVLFKSTSRHLPLLGRLAVLLSLLLAAAAARGAAYYSTNKPTYMTPSACSAIATCGGVEAGTDAQLANLSLAANIYASSTPTLVQLPLTGTAPAGSRAGMLVSSLGSLASLDALSTVKLRTYLDGQPQEEQLVDLTALKAALLAGKGSPEQLEFLSRYPFNRVELELGSVTQQLGEGLKIQYAYGVEANTARQVPGYVSRFAASAGQQYDVSGCPGGINNPERTTDTDLTNYASFGTLLAVNCPQQLKVNLEGTSPAGYRAGFVVAGLDNLADADVLGGLRLRTYRNGVQQQEATGTSLLGLSVLPTGQSLVSFPATQPFDAVSIERVGTANVLNNVQLYYGTGVASTSATQVRSNWSDPAGHYRTYSNGVLCVALVSCGASNAANAADNNLANYATVSVALGVANSSDLRLDLNGGGKAGNRAGMVLAHEGGLLNVSALERIVLSTYDAAGNVLETLSGAQLLRLETLPDGRQAISFNSTRDFATVGIKVGGVANVVDNTRIYYAFADDSTGELRIAAPTSPLPVQLVSLAVQYQAGAAQLAWATASELRSLRFVVERSANPQQGFVAVGEVAAAGTSATTRHYGFRDATAAALRAVLYYRLRQEDQDGTVAYSRVVALAASADAAAGFSLYPNPATPAQPTTLSLGASLPLGASVGVYSGQGQVLRHEAVAEGQASVRLATETLPAGLYYVVLRDASGHPLTTQRLQVLGQ